jgi:hypothetical protein
VNDTVFNTVEPNVKLSSLGAFDQFLQPTFKRQFALNYRNYDDQQRLLIPRAIGIPPGS